jgi:hypothetical protein
MDETVIWETATIDIPGLSNFCEVCLSKTALNSLEKPSVLQQLDEDKKASPKFFS